MKNGKDMLSSILKTSQIRQSGIRSVLDASMRPGLRKALETQLQEFDRIESQALYIASQRGWELQEADPAICFLSGILYRFRLSGGNADAKIPELVIQHNTRDMVKGMKDQRQFNRQDLQIHTLNQKLLDCETANIRQMQCFL